MTDEFRHRRPFYRHRPREGLRPSPTTGRQASSGKEHHDDQGLHRASMSLDGYIAGPAETGFEHLFKWYGNGDVEVPTAQPEMTLRMSPAGAEHFRGLIDMTGALVVGRKLFDSTNAWGGKHPMGRPVVVVTHSVPEGWPRQDASFSFVTDGIQAAIDQAKALAGDKVVGVNGGTIDVTHLRYRVR
jgi:dihydrofolate reductase